MPCKACLRLVEWVVLDDRVGSPFDRASLEWELCRSRSLSAYAADVLKAPASSR